MYIEIANKQHSLPCYRSTNNKMKFHLATLALTLHCLSSASSQTCGLPSGISSLLSGLLPASTQFLTKGPSPGYTQEFIVQGPYLPGAPFSPRQIPAVPNSQILQAGPQLVSNVGYQLGPQLANLPAVLSGPRGNVPVANYPSQLVNAPVIASYPNGKPCACGAPAGLVNPYLPPQSPVSALAPTTSNCLPAMVPTSSRCNYLRQIPIPPPSC